MQSRNDVAWNAVAEAHDSWDYKSQGLSGPASAVIAIAIMVATQQYELGGALLAQGASTTYVAMANAAVASLATQATLSLVNNGGDLGAVFKDLGSSSALRSLASAVVTAGLIDGLGIAEAANASEKLSMLERIQQAATQQLAKAAVNTAADVVITGAKFDEALKSRVIAAAAGVIGEIAANEIGDAYAKAKVDGIDPLEYGIHKALHAALGCGTAAMTGASCGAGAVGGAVGAAVAEAFYDPADKVVELTKKVREGELTKGEMAAQLLEWKNEGADLSQLAAAFAVFATGAKSGESVNAGAAAGDNAARNNVIETVLDLASLALSLAELKVAIDSGDKLDVLIAGGAVLIDGIAVAVPFLPAGAGLTLKIVRAGENEKLVAKVFDEAGNEVAVLSKSTEIGKGTEAGGSLAADGAKGGVAGGKAAEKVAWVDEGAGMSDRARVYDEGAMGSRSNIETQKSQAPALTKSNPDGTTSSVRFDGVDGDVLIDRKLSVVTTPKAKDQVVRQSEALSQNGLTGRWEVPMQSQANRAIKMFEELGVTNITVKVVSE